MKFDLKWLQVADNENQHMVAGHKDQEMASSNRIMVSDNQDQESVAGHQLQKVSTGFGQSLQGFLLSFFFSLLKC